MHAPIEKRVTHEIFGAVLLSSGELFAALFRSGFGGHQEVGQEVQNRENARHIAHIVIGQQQHCQRAGVKSALAGMDQPLNAQYDQWQQNHTVDPHNIPVIR